MDGWMNMGREEDLLLVAGLWAGLAQIRNEATQMH